MPVTEQQLNRATLERQLLLARAPLDAVAGVRRIVAIQAQEPASVYLALWNRLRGFNPADLDAALAGHAVIKASLMRITLHAVTADDHAALHHAMASSLRASRVNDRRLREAGRTAAEVDALADRVLDHLAQPRTNAEVEAFLDDAGGRAWWALRTYLPVQHAVTGGPWSFGHRPSYRAVQPRPAAPVQPVEHLVRRYLEGFGPASVLDVAQFSLLRRPVIRAALTGLGDAVVRRDGPGGVELWDVAGATLPAADVPAPPRLLPMWDSVLLAYADRSRVIPEAYRSQVIRRNGDVLPTLLVDGHVAGVWRPADGGIEATAFTSLPAADWAGLDDEARALCTFLAGRDPDVYRRYVRAWPEGEVRILGRTR